MAAVVYFTTDLLFSSKIRETAKQLGVEVAPARDRAQLAEAARAAKLAIVDLRRPDALEALDALPGEIQKVGFIDHERTDVMDAARERGCRALAKGQFAKELPMILGSL